MQKQSANDLFLSLISLEIRLANALSTFGVLTVIYVCVCVCLCRAGLSGLALQIYGGLGATIQMPCKFFR